MKKTIVLIAILISVMSFSFGQSFSHHSNSPFGIQILRPDSTGSPMKIMFFDYDNDGDKDLFLTGIENLNFGATEWTEIKYFIEMQENIGDPLNPLFDDRRSVYDNFPFPLGYFFPSAGDLNIDGKTDFINSALVDFAGRRTSTLLFTTGNIGNENFDEVRLDQFGLTDQLPESFFIPELVDLDADGDLDILLSGFDPAFGEEDGPDVPVFYYARNIGTPEDPNFQGWYDNPYELIPNPNVELLTSGDIDNDGDVDLLGALALVPSDSISPLYVHLNNPGANDRPSFSAGMPSPFGLPVAIGEQQFLFPNLVDIDSDGDLDLFVFQNGTGNLVLQYYENTFCIADVNEISMHLCEGEIVTIDGIVYSDPGLYNINFEGTNGCDSTILLTIESQDIDNSISLNQNILTAHQVGALYQWINCETGEGISGETDQTFTIHTSGNYAVHITDMHGCIEVSECVAVTITSTDHLLHGSIAIFPNPTQDFLTLQNGNWQGDALMELRNLEGRLMLTYKINSNGQIDLTHFAPALYFLTVKINGKSETLKLIID